MKKIYFAGLFLFFTIILIGLAFADGGYFPHPGYWVRPGSQRAIIFYENNVETMIVTSGFIGNAKDLVWIIPTPTKPEITKANEEVFDNIARLTAPKYSGGFGYYAMGEALSKDATYSRVVVLESKQVDYYDVNVLAATSSSDLVKWFNDNDYVYPEEYAYVLNHYINKGWYFTAIKVSPEAAGATEVIQDMKEGHPTPIKMTFLSDKIVFPLKISSVDFKPKDEKKYIAAKDELIGATRIINGNTWTKETVNLYGEGEWRSSNSAMGRVSDSWIDSQPGGINYQQSYDYQYRYNNYVSIDLYIIANGKYEANNFYVSYGNWFKEKKIRELGDDDNGNPFFEGKQSKYYITHFSSSLQKSQMDDDVYFKKSDDNRKVNAGPEAWQVFIYGLLIGLILFTTWLITPFGIMFISGTLILFIAKNKITRVFGWIMEILSLIITFLIGLIIFVLALTSGTIGDYVALSMVITALILILIMVLLIVLEIKYRDNRENKRRTK